MSYRSNEQHDPAQCDCGKIPVDVEQVTCSCKCDDCSAHRRRFAHKQSIERLMKRWMDAGIDPVVVADAVWMQIEPTIEQMVNRLVDARLQEKLRDLRLHAKVWRIDLDRLAENPEPKN